MVRRTKADALATRHSLLDAAEHLFQERGVSRTSLNDIATAAGTTRGAIYWHFKDKADLFNAMMERVTLPLEGTLACTARTADTTANPLLSLRDSMMSALMQTASDEQTRRVFEVATHKVEYVSEMQAVRDRHLQVRNECMAMTEEILQQAVQRDFDGSAFVYLAGADNKAVRRKITADRTIGTNWVVTDGLEAGEARWWMLALLTASLIAKSVIAWVSGGKAYGGRVAAGLLAALVAGGVGRPAGVSKGYYVRPTVFGGVTPQMTIAREEIFGPVLSVMSFTDAAEVVREANRSVYGLQAAVWTRDINKAHGVARALRAGTVHVNQYDEDDITVPFGGFKQSGVGRDKSLHAFDKYTETKTTWIRIDSPV